MHRVSRQILFVEVLAAEVHKQVRTGTSRGTGGTGSGVLIFWTETRLVDVGPRPFLSGQGPPGSSGSAGKCALWEKTWPAEHIVQVSSPVDGNLFVRYLPRGGPHSAGQGKRPRRLLSSIQSRSSEPVHLSVPRAEERSARICPGGDLGRALHPWPVGHFRIQTPQMIISRHLLPSGTPAKVGSCNHVRPCGCPGAAGRSLAMEHVRRGEAVE